MPLFRNSLHLHKSERNTTHTSVKGIFYQYAQWEMEHCVGWYEFEASLSYGHDGVGRGVCLFGGAPSSTTRNRALRLSQRWHLSVFGSKYSLDELLCSPKCYNPVEALNRRSSINIQVIIRTREYTYMLMIIAFIANRLRFDLLYGARWWCR